MFFNTKILCVVLLCLVQFSISARILILCPAPSLSHHLFYRPIIKELVLRGHEVVSITSDPIYDINLKNLTEIDVHNETYGAFNVAKFLEESKNEQPGPVNILRNALPKFIELADNVLSSPKVKELIRNPKEHFDVFINEMFMFNAHFLALKEHFKCPVIGLTSIDQTLNGQIALGMSPHPNYYAGVNVIGGPNLNFWQRLHILWHHIDFRMYYFWDFLPLANELIEKHFNIENNDAWELEKSMDLILTNSNPVFNIPRPLVPNYIQIGGVYDRERKPLSQDLKQYLDSSKNGVVYVSLGSNIKSANLPNNIRDNMLNAFKQLPYNIIWKWESETLAGKPKNVLLRKWLPQPDLLNHPNIKAFITHGGLHSLEEAINSKVPIIGIPFGADQDYNIHRAQDLGIGKELHLKSMTTESLVEIINEVITNPNYKKNITKLSELYADQITKPLDRAIWWIEYVIRHKGAKHLRSPAADLPWYKFLLLDIIGFISGIIILSVIVFIYIVKMILRLSCLKKLKDKRE